MENSAFRHCHHGPIHAQDCRCSARESWQVMRNDYPLHAVPESLVNGSTLSCYPNRHIRKSNHGHPSEACRFEGRRVWYGVMRPGRVNGSGLQIAWSIPRLYTFSAFGKLTLGILRRTTVVKLGRVSIRLPRSGLQLRLLATSSRGDRVPPPAARMPPASIREKAGEIRELPRIGGAIKGPEIAGMLGERGDAPRPLKVRRRRVVELSLHEIGREP